MASNSVANLCQNMALAVLKSKTPGTRGYRRIESTQYPKC